MFHNPLDLSYVSGIEPIESFYKEEVKVWEWLGGPLIPHVQVDKSDFGNSTLADSRVPIGASGDIICASPALS